MEDFIQLPKNNVVRYGIKDENGNVIDCVLEFDVEDIEMPLKVSKAEFQHKKNLQWLRNQFLIIDKKDNGKNDGLISWKQRQQLEAFSEFYKKEIEIIDLIIGEGNTKKILNAMHRKPYYSMFEDINDLLEPILPKLQTTTDDIIKKIEDKYKIKEDNVIE